MGGFATAFDLVSSEYGWSDEQILDLPLIRLRQITAAISRRKYMRQREENTRVSWQTRALAQYIAGGYMVEGENTAVQSASQLAFDDIEAAALGDTRGKAQVQRGTKENENGSYEKLMRAFAQHRG